MPTQRLRSPRTLPVLLVLLVGACSGPLTDQPSQELRRSVMRSIEREIEEAERLAGPISFERPASVDDLELSDEVLTENARTSGPRSYRGELPPLGGSLNGSEFETVSVSLERVIATALENNLSVQFARLSPPISRAQAVAADSAFDWVFFTSAQWNQTDEQARGSTSIFVPASTAFSRFEGANFDVGVRRRLTTGADFSVSSTYNFVDDENPNGTTVSPDPSHTANILLQFDQPLLAGFGSDVNLADVRLAQNAERDDILSLKLELISTITNVENAYWDLVQAWANLQILDRLHKRGVRVVEDLKARRVLDTTSAQYAEARSRESDRLSNIIRAQRDLRAASDRLKLLINDPRLPIGSEVLLVPAQAPLESPVAFNKLDCFLTGLEARPEIARALVAVDSAGIRIRVAENATMPTLDARGSVEFTGLESHGTDAFQTATEGQFVNFVLGLFFEQPIGNRGALAGAEIRRLERMQTIIAFQNSIRTVIAEITSALADLATNYTLIGQAELTRIAASERLRARLVAEELTTALTPEFLNLKLNDQEFLARAEQDEIAALVNYNRAIARLYQSMGTTLERNKISFDVPDGERTGPLSPFHPFLRGIFEETEGSATIGAGGQAGDAEPTDDETDSEPGARYQPAVPLVPIAEHASAAP